MKRIFMASAAAVLLLAACSGDDLKKQLAQKNQLLATREAEIQKIKDDTASREADLKGQCEQRIQKLSAQQKHQVDALNAKIAELSKKKEADKAKNAEPAKGKSRGKQSAS